MAPAVFGGFFLWETGPNECLRLPIPGLDCPTKPADTVAYFSHDAKDNLCMPISVCR